MYRGVGALTSKPYAFMARSWELKSIESIDFFDGVGSNIRIDIRGLDVMRIVPRINESINEDWITDKARFAYDGLRRQRLLWPMVRRNGELITVSWEESFSEIKKHYRKGETRIEGVAGRLAEVEGLSTFRDMLLKSGGGVYRLSDINLENDFRWMYKMRVSLEEVEISDVCVLVWSNPRYEAPLVNVRIRKAVLYNKMKVYTIGQSVNLTYKVHEMGNSASKMIELLEGKSVVSGELYRSKNPLVLMGISGCEREDMKGLDIRESLRRLSPIGYGGKRIRQGIIGHTVSMVGSYDIGGKSWKEGKRGDILYLFGVDEVKVRGYGLVVYQGHHGDIGVEEADVVLPGSSVIEKDGTYSNIEGRYQKSAFVSVPAGMARNDWRIIKALSEYLNLGLQYGKKEELEERMKELYPLKRLNRIEIESISEEVKESEKIMERKWKVCKNGNNLIIDNYYMTDVVSRASHVMALAVKRLAGKTIYRK